MFFLTSPAIAEHHIQPCFVPGDNCAAMITNAIDKATTSVHVQAYRITNHIIIDALKNAKLKGLDVIVIVDKSAKKEAKELLNDGLPLFVDYVPKIAHNKIIIIDDKYYISGSFNFTENAQNRNAENALLIRDKRTVKLYQDNFYKRLKLSKALKI